ncbi:hypothetical protein [Lysinibacillus sp. OL1]|uniref:hypothetical protein n=1 Tax=Lysinibacillus sp. OL1 TaxID=2517243 RepID=UPI00103E2906|nr:hypothetical protein [Lysinibacillus sp. OL1]TBV85420.1 hypothetical protein EW028_20935 [Lysinibacillus sp. OL1]
MKKLKLLALINEEKNLRNSIAFLENEYGYVNYQIKSELLDELESCQNQIKQLENTNLNTNERMTI